MKHNILLLLLLLFPLAACDKTPLGDPIDGLWHLREAAHRESPDAPWPDASNVQNANVYWKFNLHLLHTAHDSLLCRYQYSPSELRLVELYRHRRETDSLLTDPLDRQFSQAGVSGCGPISYRIAHLQGREMILVAPLDSLVLKKL